MGGRGSKIREYFNVSLSTIDLDNLKSCVSLNSFNRFPVLIPRGLRGPSRAH